MKFKTLSSRIIIFVAIIALAGCLAQAAVSMSNIMGSMQAGSEQSLRGNVNGATDRLKAWGDTQFAYLNAYISASDMKAIYPIANTGTAEQFAAAESYTQTYA